MTETTRGASTATPDAKVLVCLTHGDEKGGRFFACPVCVKTRKLQDATCVPNTETAGMPSVYEYTTGGALDFNY